MPTKTPAKKTATATSHADPKKRTVRVRPVPAVSRAIAILRFLGRSESPLGMKAIADELELVPSTCLHILRVLVHEELVSVDPATKRYSPGIGMLTLARAILDRLDFPSAVQPILDHIAENWDVTAIGVEVTGLDHMTVLALSRSKAPFRLQVDVGSRFPALVSATGRLAAAYSDVPWREIEKHFRELRWGKAPNSAEWRKEVEQVRNRGYSIDRGNYIPGVVIVAAPVLNKQERLVYTLVTVGLAEQLNANTCNSIAKELKHQAELLSSALLPKG